MKNLIEFEYSPWLIVVALLVGATYSYVQYNREAPWSSAINMGLALARAVLVALIAILLLGPVVRDIVNYFEEPILVIALDSSESMAFTLDAEKRNRLTEGLGEIATTMTGRGWQVKKVDLAGNLIELDSLAFNEPRTNLTGMIRAQLDEYSGGNLRAMLVISDGIFNAGFSPDLITPFTPIYTLGLGDTIPQKDLSIIDLEYNKTVYQDNRYPVKVRLRNEGINSGAGKLSIFDNGVYVDGKFLQFSAENRLVEVEFELIASTPGKHRLTVSVDSLPGEVTLVNNRAQIYLDVIDGKQRILLAAEAPTPDMKAFRAAIGANDRFEIEQAIGEPPETLDYDLVVLFNCPTPTTDRVFKALDGTDIPKLFYLGSSASLLPHLRSGIIGFEQRGNRFDQVRGGLNPNLKAFNLVNDFTGWLSAVPPMTVPFGEIVLPPNSEVIIKQKVGTVLTDRPLVYLTNGSPKTGVILGDGFWTWRLEEYRNFGETVRFDELVAKITQYLAAKPDDRQFKLYPAKDGFETGEALVFIAETYNQLFEPLYGEPVALNVFNDSLSRSYSFTPLAGSNKFSLDNLPQGLYSFTGTTTIDGKTQTARGQFSVEKPNIEAADLTADFRVLRKLAAESGGKFYSADQLRVMAKEMASLEATSVIHSRESEIFLFNLSWVLVLLLFLATTEWLTRKMMGGY